MSDIDDINLIHALRKGDNEAWKLFHERYAGRLFRTFKGILRMPNVAAECTADFIESLYSQKLASYKPAGSFEAWLMKAAVRYAIDRLREPYARHTVRLPGGDCVQEPTSADSPFLETYRNELRGLLSSIREKKRNDINIQTLWAKQIVGLTTKELARLHQCSDATIRQRCSRGMKEFRRIVEKDYSFLKQEVMFND